MRIDAVVERLERRGFAEHAGLPVGPLPPAPAILMPVLSDGRPRQATLREPALDRAAAVLVLVAPGEDGLARVILTERHTYDGVHSAEVSLPGGKVEEHDANAEAAALRESAEEIGLDPIAAGVRVLGRLDEVWIPVSRFTITPVLAVADRRPRLRASPDEVAQILEPDLDAFLPGASIRIVERTVRDWPLRYGAYPIRGGGGEELLVWGATARILGQLGALVGRP